MSESAYELLAAHIICPEDSRIAVFTTTTTDLITTLSHTNHLGRLAETGNYLTVMAEGGDVYCFFKSSGGTAAASVSRTAVTGAPRSWLIKDGVPQHFMLTRDSTGLRTKMFHVCTAAAKKIRVYMSSSRGSDQTNKATF
jgi:hypothetical protein